MQKHALSKLGAVEEYPWGDVAWKVRGKLFAVTGKDAAGVTVKPTEDQAVLVQHPAIKIAPYVGRFGWVAIEIGDAETLALVCQLIDESYAALAGSAGKPRRASKPSSTPLAHQPSRHAVTRPICRRAPGDDSDPPRRAYFLLRSTMVRPTWPSAVPSPRCRRC